MPAQKIPRDLAALLATPPDPFVFEGVRVPLRYPTKAEADGLRVAYQAAEAAEAAEADTQTGDVLVQVVQTVLDVELDADQTWGLLQRTGGVNNNALVQRCADLVFGSRKTADEGEPDDLPT